MTTVKDIIDFSKPHPNQIQGARQTILFNENVRMSIVGGAQGLYGDFKDEFEVAILDQDSNQFVTRFYSPDNNDDVIAYLAGDEMLNLVNKVFVKGFQVK